MKFLCLFVFACLVSCDFAEGDDTYFKFHSDLHNASEMPSTIHYQAHSLNELNAWIPAFYKGMRNVKVDIIMSTHPSCGDGKSCLILSQTPVETNMIFNTSEDLVRMMEAPTHAALFRDADKFSIQLHFQELPEGAEPCSRSKAALEWLQLVDSFIERATGVIRSKRRNVELLLDGIAVPSAHPGYKCLSDRWLPLVSTWTQQIEGISDPWQAFTSDDLVRNYFRFKVLNMQYISDEQASNHNVDSLHFIRNFSSSGFGKFSFGEYPYVLWNIQHQKDILEATQQYLQTEKYHEAGLRVSVSMDINKYQVYSAKATKQAWNIQLAPEATHPQVIVAPTNRPNQKHIIVTYHYRKMNWYSVYQADVSSYDTEPEFLLSDHLDQTQSEPIVAIQGRFAEATSSLASLIYGKSLSLIVASTESGHTSFFKWTPSKLELRPFPKTDIKQFSGPLKLLTLKLFYWNGVLSVLHVFSAPGCSVYADIRVIKMEGDVLVSQSRNAVPKCLVSGGDAASASVAIAASGDVEDSCSKDGKVVAAKAILFYSTQENNHIAMGLCIRNDRLKNQWIRTRHNPAIIGVGKTQSVEMLQANGETYLYEVHSNAPCPFTPSSTQAKPSLCTQPPVSVPNVLGYVFGKLIDLWDHLGKCGSMSCVIGPCDSTFKRGTYDHGTNSSVAAFTSIRETPHSSMKVAGIIEVHQGLSAKQVASASDLERKCGLPLPFDGTKMTSFPLPHVSSVPSKPSPSSLQLLVLFGVFFVLFMICKSLFGFSSCCIPSFFQQGILRLRRLFVKKKRHTY